MIIRASQALPKHKINSFTLAGFPLLTKKNSRGKSERNVHLYNKKTRKNVFITESQIDQMIAAIDTTIPINVDLGTKLSDLVAQWENTDQSPEPIITLETLQDLKAALQGEKSHFNNGNKPLIDGLDQTLI